MPLDVASTTTGLWPLWACSNSENDFGSLRGAVHIHTGNMSLVCVSSDIALR